DIKDFVDTIQNRIRKEGKLPQHGWHKAKLLRKMRKIVPTHGDNHSYIQDAGARRAAKQQQPDMQPQPTRLDATGPYTPQPANSQTTAVMQRMDDMERRLSALERHFQNV